MGIRLQCPECLAPDLGIAVPAEFQKPGVELGQRSGGKDSEQVAEVARLPGGPEVLEHGLDIRSGGVLPQPPSQTHRPSPVAARRTAFTGTVAIRSGRSIPDADVLRSFVPLLHAFRKRFVLAMTSRSAPATSARTRWAVGIEAEQ